MPKHTNPTNIPQVDRLLRHPVLVQAQQLIRREILATLTREELAALRLSAAAGETLPDEDAIAERVASRTRALLTPGFRKVVNATGVVLNTNLGRAPLPRHSLEQVCRLASGYTNLEIDLETGKRGKRAGNIERLLSLITGCQSALVVNNNAAALLLAVKGLAESREVIVSRGELIEIGGSFRLPEVITASGGLLKEVGTTNRTRISDYRKAISKQTGLIMKCHRSNFEMSGFTEDVPIKDLVGLSQESGIPFLLDLGSGALVDLSPLGLTDEPTVQSVIGMGCSLVAFSGDKLLGATQAGIIVGSRELVSRLKEHPLYRALRSDKIVLALLESVLIAYLSPNPEAQVPVLSMLHLTAPELEARAQVFCERANSRLTYLRLEVAAMSSTAGGGALPGRTLPSFGVRLTSSDGKASANTLVERLRESNPPILAIIQADHVLFDFRTVGGDDESLLFAAILALDNR